MGQSENQGGKFKFLFLKSNKNEDSTHQKLWDTAKAILKSKFLAISACIEKSEIL